MKDLKDSEIKQNDEKEEKEEEEEEEVIVYASFEDGTIDRDIFEQPDLKFKIIGLDSSTPVVQLGDTTYKGTWKDTVGTKVLFEEDLSPEPVDPVFTVQPPKMFKYKCMATKEIDFSRIFLKPKNSENDGKIETMQFPTESEDFIEHKHVLELAESTINPDASTDELMKDIVEESTMEVE